MPPKVKFSKDEIIKAAVEIVRSKGIEAVTARDVGAELGTTAKPIYTAFSSINELKAEIVTKAQELFQSYRESEISKHQYPEYKAIGIAYIRFAAQEKNLFKLLFMRNRSLEAALENDDSDYNGAVSVLSKQTGLSGDEANRFHTEMWIFTHGVATMIATSYIDWDFESIGDMLTDIYNGLNAINPERNR